MEWIQNSPPSQPRYKAHCNKNYDPFGMLMPKRSTAGAFGYRYGFNGKENDNEAKGLGNQQDYGMRIYDARLGRFLSVDPLTTSYPWYSPYHFGGNNPIRNIDLDGGEPKDRVENWVDHSPDWMKSEALNDAKLGPVDVRFIYDNVSKTYWFVARDQNSESFNYWKHNPGARQNELLSGSSAQANGAWNVFKTKNKLDAEAEARYQDNLQLGFVGTMVGLPGALIYGKAIALYLLSEVAEELAGVPIPDGPVDLWKYEMKQRAKREIIGESLENAGRNFEEFIPTKAFKDRDGNLTNGTYTVSPQKMAPHVDGNYPGGKSQFKHGVDADQAVLSAAEYADKNRLWGLDGDQNKAKVFVKDGIVGYSNGEPTQWLNVYRTNSGTVHGTPTSTPGKKK